MFKKTAITGLAIVTALAFAGAGQASANTGGGTKSQRVSYAGLDLSQSHDAKVLVGRIQRAASQVCRIDNDSGIDRLSRGYRDCVRMASTNAVSDLNSPMVTAAYQGKSKFEVAAK